MSVQYSFIRNITITCLEYYLHYFFRKCSIFILLKSIMARVNANVELGDLLVVGGITLDVKSKDKNQPAPPPNEQKLNENTESPAQDHANQEIDEESQPTPDRDVAGDEDDGAEGVCFQNETAEIVPETAGNVDAEAPIAKQQTVKNKNNRGPKHKDHVEVHFKFNVYLKAFGRRFKFKFVEKKMDYAFFRKNKNKKLITVVNNIISKKFDFREKFLTSRVCWNGEIDHIICGDSYQLSNKEKEMQLLHIRNRFFRNENLMKFHVFFPPRQMDTRKFILLSAFLLMCILIVFLVLLKIKL